jgi:hypothetical protein
MPLNVIHTTGQDIRLELRADGPPILHLPLDSELRDRIIANLIARCGTDATEAWGNLIALLDPDSIRGIET